MNKKEAAEILGIAESTLWLYTKAGRIPAQRTGGARSRLDYDVADLMRLKQELDATPGNKSGPKRKDITDLLEWPADELPFQSPNEEKPPTLFPPDNEPSSVSYRLSFECEHQGRKGKVVLQGTSNAWYQLLAAPIADQVAAQLGIGALPPRSDLIALPAPRVRQEDLTLLAQHLSELVGSDGEWCGTASELLHALNQRASDLERAADGWPKGVQRLGTLLNRIAPNLRERGIDLEKRRRAGFGTRIIYLRRGR